MNSRLLYILLFVTIFTACKKKAAQTSPHIASITEAIFASGHIEPKDQFVLTAFSEGYLQKEWVRENDRVSEGQLLFTLDNTTASIEQNAAARNLQLAIQNASENSPARLQLQAELAAAKERLQGDSLQYVRLKRLYETNTVSKVELENAELAYKNSVNAVKSINENIQSTDITLQQNLINSQSQYQTSSAGQKYFLLRSTGNCRVYRVLKHEGELTRKGEAVALLGHPDSLLLVLMVDETGIRKVKEGQQALVELNTHQGQTFPATISRIYPYFDEETQSYKVEATFDKQPSGIIAGTLIQANIVVATNSKAMLIPRSFLTPDEKVILDRDGKPDTTAIKVGILSTEWVEVVEGLTVQDKIIKAN
jgi:multidrug efflux pump subunit AcrA (membrane-fusion protein)